MGKSISSVCRELEGQVINGVTFRLDCVELHCGDNQSLRLFALPRMMFNADDQAERLNDAPLPEQLANLVGKKIGGVRKDAMNDYCISIGDFAVLTLGDGKSLSGQTGMVIGGSGATLVF